MSLKYRRILYSSFIAFFIIVTPIVILYATGYRYSLKNNRVEKIGILHLESLPRGADILVNNELTAKTPSRFIKLLPDKYQVRINKEGYYPWTKEVEIKSSLTTFYKNVVLFKNSLPFNISEGIINIVTTSPNREKLVYSVVNDNIEQIRLVNLKTKAEFLIDELKFQTYDSLGMVSWSPNQNKLILEKTVNGFGQYLIVDTDSLEIEEVSDITRLDFDVLKWDEDSNDKIYGLRNDILHQIDLINNKVSNLYAANIQDFQVRGNEILIISEVINEVYLNKLNLDGQTASEINKIKIPAPSEFKLISSRQNFIVLIDTLSRDLFIINTNAFDAEDINNSIILQDKAKNIVWSSNGTELLFYTDFEISTFDFTTQQKNLITRYGDVITQALWYPGNDYIIYQVNDTIKAIEKSGSGTEGRNDTTLAKLENVNQLGIDNSGQNLFFKGTVGTQQGLYQLQLQ